MHSQAVEDYLKTIHELQREQGKVATSALAERLGVAPASVTGMIKKLAEMQLVAYEPYQGVVLTDAGRRAALEVIRHHRLIEVFLSETLGVPWDRVHEEAHRIEHVLSEDLEDRIDDLLGHPATCPHGSPIPTREGTIAQPAPMHLADLEAGQSAVVAEVRDEDPELLRYVARVGLYPNVVVHVLDKAALNGLLTLRVGEAQNVLSREVALQIFVIPQEEQ